MGFQTHIFALNFWGNETRDAGPPARPADAEKLPLYHVNPEGAEEAKVGPAGAESLYHQVRNTMLVTVFVFVGIEGAHCGLWAKGAKIWSGHVSAAQGISP